MNAFSVKKTSLHASLQNVPIVPGMFPELIFEPKKGSIKNYYNYNYSRGDAQNENFAVSQKFFRKSGYASRKKNCNLAKKCNLANFQRKIFENTKSGMPVVSRLY